MAMNDIGFVQSANFLNALHEQATGQKQIAPSNESEFVSVGQTVLKMGYEPLLNAFSAVLRDTIFAIRPYNRKFGGLFVSEERWGAMTRKISFIDASFEDDEKFDLVDGQAIDHYKVKKPKAIQFNFYGETVVQDHISIPTEQLDLAFTGSAQFGEFISGVLQNISDRIEQKHENAARATIRNFVAGKLARNNANEIVHVLTEYNQKTGLSLTEQDIYKPENFKGFVTWLNSRLATISEMMTERTLLYHTNVTGKEVMRHTPVADQRVYLYRPFEEEIKSMALSGLYNDSYIKISDFEGINFWQAVENPMSISSTPVYLQEDGTLTAADSPVSTDKLLGVIFDRDAMSIATVKHTVASTPLNAAGLYSNTYWHFTDKYLNDFTENGVVLLLD